MDVVGAGCGANYGIIAGALARLMNDGFEPSSYIATSGSSIVFSFLADGRTPSDFLQIAQDYHPVKLMRPNRFWPIIPGLITMEGIADAMGPYIPKTFAKCKVPLTIITTDSDMMKPYYFSSALTPKVSVVKVLQAAISVPWLARHVKINGIRANDGGTTHHFAIDLPEKPALGIRVHGADSDPKLWRWWGSYSLNHFRAMIKAHENAHIKTAIWKKSKILTIPSIINSTDYRLVDNEMLKTLYKIGYQYTDEKLASGWTWRSE